VMGGAGAHGTSADDDDRGRLAVHAASTGMRVCVDFMRIWEDSRP
jgi:hypothetical protein